MPRIAGVSSSSTVWCSRRNPRPRTVLRCGALHAIGLFTSVTRSLFLSAIALTRDLFDRLPALRGDLGGRAHLAQPVERRAHDVVRIGRADALRQDVADPGHLEHRA